MTADRDQDDHVLLYDKIDHDAIFHIDRNRTVIPQFAMQLVKAEGRMCRVEFEQSYRARVRFTEAGMLMNKDRELPLVRFCRNQFWHLFLFRRFPGWLFPESLEMLVCCFDFEVSLVDVFDSGLVRYLQFSQP